LNNGPNVSEAAETWMRTHDLELQRQRCKNQHRQECSLVRFENKNNLEKALAFSSTGVVVVNSEVVG
jgi:hypothetical protein